MSWVQLRILANQIDAGIVIIWPELKSEFGSGQVGAVAGPRLQHADAQFVTGTLSGKKYNILLHFSLKFCKLLRLFEYALIKSEMHLNILAVSYVFFYMAEFILTSGL